MRGGGSQYSGSRPKQRNQDVNDLLSGSHQNNEETQEDECGKSKDYKDVRSSSLPSSSREKRRRKREEVKSKEMTEEEMMDLALRLSEQEADIAAVKQQQDEEAMVKAIEESVVSQTQPCLPSQSQSILADTHVSLMPSSRRKLLYSNGNANCRSVFADGCSSNADMSQDPKGKGAEKNKGKKRKRKDGSPLLEMPDLSQTQKIESQTSPFSTEPLSVPLDSPQSSDSTQIEDYQLHKSPVFPLSPSMAYKPEIHISRLSQEVLETYKTSGYVLCSQEGLTSAHQSLLAQPKSTTVPKSPTCSSSLAMTKSTAFPTSPVFSELDQGEDGEMEQSPEHCRSPVFGRTSPNEKPPQAFKSKASDCNTTCNNSGFMFGSQESMTSSSKSMSCQPRSPVFPQSPGVSKNLALSKNPALPKSPLFSETNQGQDGESQQSHDHSASPVFDRTGQQQMGFAVQNTAEELWDSSTCSCDGCNSSYQDTRDLPLPQCLRKQNRIDPNQEDMVIPSKSDDVKEPNDVSKDWNSVRTERTSSMLHWSDEDDDVESVISCSPVFPEERAIHQPDRESSTPHYMAAASGSPSLNCSPNPQRCGPVTGVKKAQSLGTFTFKDGINSGSSSSSTLPRQQQQQQVLEHSTTEQEAGPVHSQEPVTVPTVHYYWGVPFCPRGLEPDAYTQVILAQLEVYEKSLKQTQRCLLRKAEWGEAILPKPEISPSPESPGESPEQPILRRRGLRLRSKRTCETPSPEAEKEEDKKDAEEEDERERRNKEEEEGEVDIDDCEVCPETQLSDNDDDSTQDLSLTTDARAELKAEIPALPEIDFTLQDEPSDQEESQEVAMEVDAPVEAETKGSIIVSNTAKRQNFRLEEEEANRDAEVEEIKDQELQMSMPPELEQAAAPQMSKPTMECPICQGSFPVTEIEMHAAYCDGEVTVLDEADCFEVSLKPRRKRSRKPEVTAAETSDPSNLDTKANQKLEKYYMCQKAVLLRDYGRHTEDCIQRRVSNAAPRGNLLSALDKTESRDSDAGPSRAKVQPREVIDLLNEEDGEGTTDMSSFRISHSPIRAFTPISEATDCLIDFKKQQQVKKPIQRP